MLQFIFQPFPELHTERLVLREMEPADIDDLYALRTNKDAMYYLNKELQTREQVAQMIEAFRNDHTNNNAITWAISQAGIRTLIGTIGFWRTDKAHHRAEIGYMLHPAYWRKGYLNEAMTAVMRYGMDQMNLHSVEGHVNPANAASIGLLEKHGFVKEAYFRENYHYRGKFFDTVVYCKVKEK